MADKPIFERLIENKWVGILIISLITGMLLYNLFMVIHRLSDLCIDKIKPGKEWWLPTEQKPTGCSQWSCGWTLNENPNINNACVCHKWIKVEK